MDNTLVPDSRSLPDTPRLTGLESTIFDAIIATLRPERWSCHIVVMTLADTRQRFYVLLKGRVKVINQNPENGREITLFLLGPCDGVVDTDGGELCIRNLEKLLLKSGTVYA